MSTIEGTGFSADENSSDTESAESSVHIDSCVDKNLLAVTNEVPRMELETIPDQNSVAYPLEIFSNPEFVSMLINIFSRSIAIAAVPATQATALASRIE